MSPIRLGGLTLPVILFLAACGGTTQPTIGPATVPPTPPPSSAVPTTAEPTPAPTSPAASLDPSLSDAGIAGRVTIVNDTRNGLDGTYDIYGLAADGSECSGAFEEPDYIVVAWVDEAPVGQLFRLGVSVTADDIPPDDGVTYGITDGGVSFDLRTQSGIGGLYSGNSTREDEGSSTISVTRAGSNLTFDFEAVTFDGVNFTGQMVCVGV